MNEELKQYAQTLPGRPDHFGYFGDTPDFDKWCIWPEVSNSRDAETLDRVNFEVVTDDITERCEDGFLIESSSHWAVGWVTQVRVDTTNEEALRIALEWKNRLDDYPVADEEKLSAAEHEEMHDDFDCVEDDIADMCWDDEELITLLDLDIDGCPNGWRTQYVVEQVREIYFEEWRHGSGYVDLDSLRPGLEDIAIEDADMRKFARIREFEKYQLRLV